MPQARISTEFTRGNDSAARAPNNVGSMPPTASSVSATARGCSKISFCMKCRYGPELDGGAACRHVDDGAFDALPRAS